MNELRETELRDLLERVATVEGEVDIDRHWSAGRRRRARRGVGVAVAACLGLVVAAGAVAQTGLLGGAGTSTTPLPTGPAAVPDSLETFVFAAPGQSRPPDVTAMLVHATPEALAGTSWVLQDGMWNAPTSASGLTGTAVTTRLDFEEAAPGPDAWSVDVGGCAVASLPELALDGAGRFGALEPVTSEPGCDDELQAAGDFWHRALAGGGQLTLAGDGRWLLLSVDAPPRPTPTTAPEPEPGPDPAPTAGPVPTRAPRADAIPTPTGVPTGDATPTGGGGVRPTGTPAPGDGDTEAPAAEPAPSPSGGAGPAPTTGSAPPGATPGTAEPTVPRAAAGFTAAGTVTVDPPWPSGGGELFAPTVRAGAHDSFDRVVIDLTGTGDPGWRAGWTDDPRLDGSGSASDVAGDSVLELSLSGMGYPEPGSDVYSEGTFGLDTHTLSAVVEVHRTTPFEGMLQVFVGVRGEPRPYRVFLLQDPLRLVIDVQTGS